MGAWHPSFRYFFDIIDFLLNVRWVWQTKCKDERREKNEMERTLVILKPDAVERKLIGDITSRFEKRNFTITHIKMLRISRELAEIHYAHVKRQSIFEDMMRYITSGPVVALILEGERVISSVRNMVGKTNCFESPAGTIRGDFGMHRFKNLIHASDSPENAVEEIARFFPEIQ